MSNIINKLKNKSGITMVEIIVSVAVIAIVSLVMVSAFSSAMNIMKRSTDKETASDNAYTRIESINVAEESNDIASFESNGVEYKVRGKLIEETDVQNDSESTFRKFESVEKTN